MGCVASRAASSYAVAAGAGGAPLSCDGGGGAAGGTPLFSAAEVASHSGRDSAWLVVGGKVYDATPFMRSHPGGSAIILRYAGARAGRVGRQRGKRTAGMGGRRAGPSARRRPRAAPAPETAPG